MTEEEIKELAKQLSCPSGEAGSSVGDQMEEGNLNMIKAAFQATGFNSSDYLLELGHGNASHVQHLLPKDVYYHGLEVSSLMMDEARKNNTGRINSEKATFGLFDGKNISLDNNTCTKIITVNTIYFWKEPLSLLRETYRVLAPLGKVILVFCDKNFMEKLPFCQYGFNLYEESKVKDLLNAAGFREISSSKFSDLVKSKMGEEVQREYLVLTAEK